MTSAELERYLSEGAERIAKDFLKASLTHPKAGAFAARFARASQRAEKRRVDYEKRGIHIPSFLIASITARCNLHCAGCYARSLSLCGDEEASGQLSADEWGKVFAQAGALGVGFILLAGGEPLYRMDVLRKAGEYPDMLFPVFTNGTLFTAERYALFEKCRNLIPVFSLEGGRTSTDSRRELGVYDKVLDTMARVRKEGIPCAVSVTVTTENVGEVMDDSFIDTLANAGAKAVIFVEYVPTDDESSPLAPDDQCRAEIARRMEELRQKDRMLYLSFPGDETATSGCLAAGRGFFHINPYGGAEPCPFSPYSDVNVKNASLLDVLQTPLFRTLRASDMLRETHTGGCTLYQQRSAVEAMVTHG